MTNWIIKRTSNDEVLRANSTPQSSSLSAQSANLIDNFGGTEADYAYQEITPTQFASVRSALALGKATFVASDGTVTESTAVPSLSNSVDEQAGEVTVTCNVGDSNFTGEIVWECTSPDGVTNTMTDNMIAGVDDWVIATGQVGSYTVRVRLMGYGFASIEFEEA